MKKKVFSFIALCGCVLLLGGCGKVATLKNGEDAVVKMSNDLSISANDLYKEMKTSNGLSTLLTIMDKKVFETEFKDKLDEAKEYGKAMAEQVLAMYGEETILQYYTSVEKFKAEYTETYKNNYLKDLATEEYAKSLITDKQIEKYYNDEAVGDIEISRILITSDAKSGATDDEKKAAEEAAKKTAKEVIKKLDDAKKNNEDLAKKFVELVKEYSKDETSKANDGKLEKLNKNSLSNKYDELIDAAYKLKEGEYSSEVITTADGFEIIYVNKINEKDTLENLKNSIIEVLSKRMQDEVPTISIDADEFYRNKYEMKFEDDELASDYKNYIQNQKAAATKNNQ